VPGAMNERRSADPKIKTLGHWLKDCQSEQYPNSAENLPTIVNAGRLPFLGGSVRKQTSYGPEYGNADIVKRRELPDGKLLSWLACLETARKHE